MLELEQPPPTPPPSSPRWLEKSSLSTFVPCSPAPSSPFPIASSHLQDKKPSSKVLSFSLARKKRKRKESNEVPAYWGLTTMTSPNFNTSRLTSRQQASLISRCEALGTHVDKATPEVLSSLSPFVLDRLADESSGFVPWTQQLHITNVQPEKRTKLSPKGTRVQRLSMQKESISISDSSTTNNTNLGQSTAICGNLNSITHESMTTALNLQNDLSTDFIEDFFDNKSDPKHEFDNPVEEVKESDNILCHSYKDMSTPQEKQPYSECVTKNNFYVPVALTKTKLETFYENIHDNVSSTMDDKLSTDASHDSTLSCNFLDIIDIPILTVDSLDFKDNRLQKLTENGHNDNIEDTNSINFSTLFNSSFKNSMPSLPVIQSNFSKLYQLIVYKRAIQQIELFFSGEGSCCQQLLHEINTADNPFSGIESFLSVENSCTHRKYNELLVFFSQLLV